MYAFFNHAIRRKLDQNRTKNKKVTDVCLSILKKSAVCNAIWDSKFIGFSKSTE